MYFYHQDSTFTGSFNEGKISCLFDLILFIIIDLDLAFLYPYAVANDSLGLFGFWSLIFFLAVFLIGFIYEWKKGALEWE